MLLVFTTKPSCRKGRRATAYKVPVSLMSFKVIQGQ